MIPVEYLWLTMIAVFGFIGMARGLWKEMGVTTVLLITLAALNLGERYIINNIIPNLPVGFLASAPEGTIQAIYYGAVVVFAAFISYQGITLEFPVRKAGGLLKWLFGFMGGLVNGYLIVGTIWNVTSNAKYFGTEISTSVTATHQKIVGFLPISLMNASEAIPYIALGLGLLLLLAIILK